MLRNRLLIFSIAAMSVVSCNNDNTANGTSKEHLKQLREVTEFNTKNMDLHVHAHDDFYNHSNGGWMKNTEIPSDEAKWGSFNELRESNNQMTLALVNELLAKEGLDPSSEEGKIYNFVNAGLDIEARNKAGIEPIKKQLENIDQLKSVQDIIDYSANNAHLGGLLNLYVSSDMKNSKINALNLSVANFGLPERSYYIENDQDSKAKREKYVAHIAEMLPFIGYSSTDAQKTAEDILAFETKLAKPMLTKEARRKPENRYNPKSIAELSKLNKQIDWNKYFTQIGAKNVSKVNVSQPKFIAALPEILSGSDVTTIKSYLKWMLLNGASTHLSQEINDKHFDFYGKVLSALQEQKPLKERVLSSLNRVMGEALGKVYVAEYFPKEAKESAVDMVANLKKAYEIRINKLDWMSETTKKKAIEKLYGMDVKIGYPDKWKDYSKLDITTNNYQNIENYKKFRFDDNISKIGKEVDRTEWFMNPQTVNAYYSPQRNEIVFPAAILQPPFFDYKADAAINYGGMGAVIGHEISHGFDDQGAKFDAIGNMENWWTPQDLANFKERGDKLVAQYDKFEALPGVFVNGRFTLGENIGDLGGVNSAYEALQLYLEKNGRPEKIDDMTPEQRFFVNWATVWRSKYRDEALKKQIKTDPHSPGQFRAVGPLVNVDAFYKAFNIKENDKMFVPVKDRVRIW